MQKVLRRNNQAPDDHELVELREPFPLTFESISLPLYEENEGVHEEDYHVDINDGKLNDSEYVITKKQPEVLIFSVSI